MSSPNFLTASFRDVTAGAESKAMPVRAITSAVARDGAIILATAIETDLPIFMRNPCLLAHHPWMYAERPPASVVLGHVLDVRIQPDTDDGGGYVDMDVLLAEDINPEAKLTADLIRNKDIRAVSIGWLDRGSVTRASSKEQIAALPRFARESLLSGVCKRVYTRIELFELSIVYGAGSDRDALFELRALLDSRKQKEAEMPTPVPTPEKPEGEARVNVPTARAGHPQTNDVMARMRGAYESLATPYYEEPSCEPPSPEVCRSVAAILREVADAVEALCPPEGPAAGSAAAPTVDASARAGKSISAATRAVLQAAVDSHKAHGECMHSIEEMLDVVDDDSAEDDGEGERAVGNPVSDFLRTLGLKPE